MNYHYLISFVGVKNKSLAFGDDICWFDKKLTYEDVEEARVFIAQKKHFDSVSIINIIPIEKETSYDDRK